MGKIGEANSALNQELALISSRRVTGQPGVAISEAISAHIPNEVRTDGSHLNMVTTMMAMQTDKSNLRGETDSMLPDIRTKHPYEEGGRTSLAAAVND